MPLLRVAICTNRSPDAVLPCVRELAAQGLPPVALLLVASGLDEAAAREHERALATLLPGSRVLSEPRPGLSLARNAALAVCDDDDVLAFVDDDAIPGKGWLAALRTAWDAAPEEVAALGGPIRPRFLAPRPRWLSDAMLSVLTVLDYGPAPADLDPTVRTLYGANVSFLAGPLRAVGGFDPSFGHQGERTFFGEEDEVQRALARSGHLIRYEPAAWVWHLVPPERLTRRSVLRRRFHYGASLGRRRGRAPAAALRAGLRSALGVPAALAARNQRSAMERAVRASENAGVLLWRALARRDPGEEPGPASPSRPTPGEPDVLLVSPGTTAGWRRADAELVHALEELGLSVATCTTDFRFARHLRRGMLMTDLAEAGALRRAVTMALRRERPRAIIFSSPQATMLQPRRRLEGATAVRFDAPAAVNRSRFGGTLLHALERRALGQVRLLLPWGLAPSSAQELADVDTPMVALPTPVELTDGDPGKREPIALAYAGDPGKKGLDLAASAWAIAGPSGWRLVVTGIEPEAGRRFLRRRGVPEPEGIEWAGVVDRERYRELVERTSVFLAASRYEDFGLAQLEALAGGCLLVTAPSDGPYAALEPARALDGRLVAEEISVEALARALESALALSGAERRDYADRARELVRPYSREQLTLRLLQEVLPVLLPGSSRPHAGSPRRSP